MSILRRLILGVGAALLVFGWGLTRYAHEQQQSLPANAARFRAWDAGHTNDGDVTPSSDLYAAGVTIMASGAGCIGFGALRLKRERNYGD